MGKVTIAFVLVIALRPAGLMGGREIDFRALARRIFRGQKESHAADAADPIDIPRKEEEV